MAPPPSPGCRKEVPASPSTPAGISSERRNYRPAKQGSSPVKRGNLGKGYEGRFGTAALIAQDVQAAGQCPQSARNKKPGVTTFTDPMNPFAREASKKITRVGDARGDADRAGARTRNPGMIPRTDAAGCERAQSEDSRPSANFVVHQYSTSPDWRPGKRCPDYATPTATPTASPESDSGPRSPRCSRGMANVMPDGNRGKSVLENYLNDMKRAQKSLRNVPATPSVYMQRMNDERVKLPSERRFERVGTTSDRPPPTPREGSEANFSVAEELLGGSRPMSARIRRSFSCDPRIQRSAAQGELNDREDNYGFTRKREVSGGWTSRSRGIDLLHHAPGRDEPEPVSTPRRCERLERKADERFVEMVTHMKASNPEQRKVFETFKTRSECSVGLIEHDNRPF